MVPSDPLSGSYSAVMLRAGGASSIPEMLVLEPRSRGVLDHPVKPATTAEKNETGERKETAHSRASV
jgi:hypothetical protein